MATGRVDVKVASVFRSWAFRARWSLSVAPEGVHVGRCRLDFLSERAQSDLNLFQLLI